MAHATVDEWLTEDGQKVEIYWRPLTGVEQKKIDSFSSNVGKICATVKYRARDEKGRLVFADLPVESLENDFDFQVLQALAFMMVAGMGHDAVDKIGEFEKE